MDPSRRKELKKMGKRLAAKQSEQLKAKLAEANPAPIGSDEWAENYRIGTIAEKQLRLNPRNIIPAMELAETFVLDPIDPQSSPVKGWYIQCLNCSDVLHSVATELTTCSCERFSIIISHKPRVHSQIQSDGNIRWVKLIGKGPNQGKKKSIFSKILDAL